MIYVQLYQLNTMKKAQFIVMVILGTIIIALQINTSIKVAVINENSQVARNWSESNSKALQDAIGTIDASIEEKKDEIIEEIYKSQNKKSKSAQLRDALKYSDPNYQGQ